jgi:hypothetical protein
LCARDRRQQGHAHGHVDRLADHQRRAAAQHKRFSRGFLIVAPGLTIKDRLRDLQPNDPDSDYASREPMPTDLLEEVNRAKLHLRISARATGRQHPAGAWSPAPVQQSRRARQPAAAPRTISIDSKQLESGEVLDANFRAMASDEIERFRRQIIERTGDARQAENLTDPDLLREVMTTVGKPGRLGADIRCVVSVSMLTEGWDVSTVTHALGVRAFGTQLLCEQVIGRALRRQSYDLNEEGLFNVEYADVLGIPCNFNATPTLAPPHETGASRINGSTPLCDARAAPIRLSSNTRRLDPTEGSHPSKA